LATYLVTGGLGFIGSHLCAALYARGDNVRILDDLSTGQRENTPPQAEVIIGDVADEQLVAKVMQGVDGCFHLAAVASVQKANEEWVATHRTNLTGSICVFSAAKSARATQKAGNGAPVPVVYASSAAVYGDNQNVPLAEQAATRPLSAYGADKLGSEQHGLVAAHVHGISNIGLRFFNVYGPRQDPKSPYSGVIAIFADRLSAHKPVDIFGDGLQSRDFIFVGDVVRFLIAAMTEAAAKPKTAQVFNVCTGRETTLLALLGEMAALKNITPEIRHSDARTGDIKKSLGNPDRAAKTLGVKASVTLHDGLAETLAWIDQSKASA
jgi:UDP-glucose 4-epimerase